MIEARELRIGSYYHNNVEIVKLSKKDLIRLLTDDNIHMSEPIQLTEEWLKKFGFVNDDFFEGQMIAMGMSYSKRYTKEGVQLSVRSNEDGKQYFILLWYGTKIEFLHHLQNIFYDLRGVELELI